MVVDWVEHSQWRAAPSVSQCGERFSGDSSWYDGDGQVCTQADCLRERLSQWRRVKSVKIKWVPCQDIVSYIPLPAATHIHNSKFLPWCSMVWVFSCFLRSWGRLKGFLHCYCRKRKHEIRDAGFLAVRSDSYQTDMSYKGQSMKESGHEAEILLPLKILTFEGQVDFQMTCEMIPFRSCGSAIVPVTGQTKIVGRSSSHMVVRQVFKQGFDVIK